MKCVGSNPICSSYKYAFTVYSETEFTVIAFCYRAVIQLRGANSESNFAAVPYFTVIEQCELRII